MAPIACTGSWGFGQIKSYDATVNRLIIDFEGKPGHSMDPAFCVDKLEILPDDNLLVRYRNDRAALEEEMKNADAFVVKYIASKPDRSASQLELERIFKQLFGFKPLNLGNVPEADLKKATKTPKRNTGAWWNKAKESLFRDPCVACPKNKTTPTFCAKKRSR